MTVILPGNLGKPRPALVVQSDRTDIRTPTVTLLPFTGTLVDAPLFRVEVGPTIDNGLVKRCAAQLDKATTVPRDKVGGVIGRLDDVTMLTVNRALVVFLGLG